MNQPAEWRENFRSETSQPISFQDFGQVGGTQAKGNMATSLDDDLEFNNQDYYSLLNVRKEVGSLLFRGAI